MIAAHMISCCAKDVLAWKKKNLSLPSAVISSAKRFTLHLAVEHMNVNPAGGIRVLDRPHSFMTVGGLQGLMYCSSLIIRHAHKASYFI